VVDSSLSTPGYNESNEKLENTKKLENQENTKKVEKEETPKIEMNDLSIEENQKTQKNEKRGKLQKELEKAFTVSGLDTLTVNLIEQEQNMLLLLDETKKPEGYTTLKCVGKLNDVSVEFLLDTGASKSLIRSSFVNKLQNYGRVEWEDGVLEPMRVANNMKIYPTGIVKLKVVIGETERIMKFLVFDEVSYNVILGVDYLFESKWVIDTHRKIMKNEKSDTEVKLIVHQRDSVIPVHYVYLMDNIEIPRMSERVASCGINGMIKKENLPRECMVKGIEEQYERYKLGVVRGIVELKSGSFNVVVGNFGQEDIHLAAGTAIAVAEGLDMSECCIIGAGDDHGDSTTDCTTGGESQEAQENNVKEVKNECLNFNFEDVDIDEIQLESLKSLLHKYNDLFRTPNAERTAKVGGHMIDTGNEKPINQVPYRAGYYERGIIEEQVQKMLKDGIISESKSPWASPVVLVKKKDGSTRFCVDYRKLNAITKKDVYPIPRIDDSLNALGGMKYCSTFDLAQGYWQIPMDQDAKLKTAFTTHCGLYEFNVMPFGLCNAPATFQRAMDMALAGMKWQSCLVYIDDIIVFSPTFEKHLKDLEELFDRLLKVDLVLKASKCFFCKKSVEYLGHVVSKDGVEVDKKKIAAMEDFPIPKNVTDVKSFLGVTGYYRKFIKDYAKLASPLTELTKVSKVEFKWTAECETAFKLLKNLLVNAPILKFPDFKRKFKIQTDACDAGLGAVLAQEDENGKEYVIMFASRTLSDAEKKWSTREKEALGVIWACELFRPYVVGQQFVVETDHESLKWIMNSKHGGRIARWNMRLQEFDMEIRHRRGKANANADGLSRCPVELIWGEIEEENICYDVTAVEVVITTKKKIVIPEVEEMKAKQREDKDLGLLIDYLQVPHYAEQRRKFTLEELTRLQKLESFYKLREDGLLMHIQKLRRHGVSSRHELIVVPKHYIPTIIKYFHDGILSVHPGIGRTVAKIQERFYFDGFSTHVKKYVKACLKCNLNKFSEPKRQGLLQQFPSFKPFDIVGIDITGPFNLSYRGNKYVLVMMDQFTRWVELRALPEITADAVAQVLFEDIICRHGCPSKILSDQGQQFIGNVMKNLCDKLGITKIQTSTFHPQTNAHVERFNRYLVAAMRMNINSVMKNWDDHLASIAFAFRTGMNSATGDTPFFLIHGRDARMPIDVQLNTRETSKEVDLLHGLKRAQKAAKECQKDLMEKNKKLFDRNQKAANINEGDLVMLYFPNKKLNKLKSRCEGPYRVITKISALNFKIKRLKDGREEMVHAQRMRKYQL